MNIGTVIITIIVLFGVILSIGKYQSKRDKKDNHRLYNL